MHRLFENVLKAETEDKFVTFIKFKTTYKFDKQA